MKKILSIVLALVMCLGSVALLASCAGESAYEIAVKNGFEGDEAAWLESLKGDKGDKGDNGAKGDKGDAAQVPTIGENGNWFVGDTDTGVKATVIVDPASFELVTAECEVWSGAMPALTVKYDLVDPADPTTVVKECTVAITEDMIVGDNPFTTAGDVDFTITMLGMEQELTVKVTAYYALKEATWTYNSTPAFTAVVKTLADGTSSEIALTEGMVTGEVDTAKLGTYTVDVKLDDTTAGKCVVNVIYFEDFDLEDTEVATMGALLKQLGYKLPAIDKNNMDPAVTAAQIANVPNLVFPNTDITYESDVLLKGAWNRPNFVQTSIKEGRLYLRNSTAGVEGVASWDGAVQILPEGALDNLAVVDADGNKLYSYTIQFDAEIAKFMDASGENKTTNGFGLMLHTALLPDVADDPSTTDKDETKPSYGTQQSIRFRQYAVIRAASSPDDFGVLTELSAASRPALGKTNANGFMLQNRDIMTKLFPNGQPNNEALQDWRLWAVMTYRFVVTPTGLTVLGKTDQVEDFVVLCETDWENAAATQEGYTAFMNAGNAINLMMLSQSATYFDNIAVWAGTGEMPTLPAAPEVAE